MHYVAFTQMSMNVQREVITVTWTLHVQTLQGAIPARAMMV